MLTQYVAIIARVSLQAAVVAGAVVLWAAVAHAQVTVNVAGFTLSCAASAAEDGEIACTLTNDDAENAAAWPVVAILHSSEDANRALVTGSPVDVGFGDLSPEVETEDGAWWINQDVLVGYVRFDWSGDAAADGSSTFNIEVKDDDDYEGAERFYISLAPSGSRGVSGLYTNKQALTIPASDTKSMDADLSALDVAPDGGTPLTLSPAFSSDTRSYTASVAYEVTAVVVTPTASHGRAGITVNGTAVESGKGSAALPVAMGQTTITVVVTAENDTTATYTVTVTRSMRPATVSATTPGFTLSCPATVTEGAKLTCTLTSTSGAAADWPVVGILHSSVDADRALITEDSEIAESDLGFQRDLQLSAAPTDPYTQYNYGYGELFSGESFSRYTTYGYEKFDWDGEAAAGGTREVVVRTYGDLLTEEGDEIFYVTLAPHAYTGLAQLVDNTAPIILQNNPNPLTVSIEDASATENAGSLAFRVTLSRESSEEVTVDYTTTDGTATAGTDYTQTSGTLTFPAGTTEQTIRVTLINDPDEEDEEETFSVTLSNPQAATLGAASSATGTIHDNDNPWVTVSFASTPMNIPEGGTGTVTVILSTDPERTVEIPLVASGATVNPSRVTFTNGNPTPQTVIVMVPDDAIDNDGKSVQLSFGMLPERVTGGNSANIAITDNDGDDDGDDDGGGGGGGGGGGDEEDSRDLHGGTPAQATRVRLDNTAPWASSTVGQINTADDIDYFQFILPQAGMLVVETTGSTATVGTVWQGEEELGRADSGGVRRNFRLTLPVKAGPVVIAVAGYGTGAYTLATRLVVGFLENPGPNSFQSGVGVISGWVCEADEVEITLGDLAPQLAAYGTERADTAYTPAGEELCGDTDNGFGLLFNWNLLGDGEHEVIVRVDGVALDRTTVTVTILGEEFKQGAEGACIVADFPTADESRRVVWQPSQQNFVLAEGPQLIGIPSTPATGLRGVVENPAPYSFQSGIGVLSGWVCEADEVEISLGDLTPQLAAYGTERADTAPHCGDTDNGFGLLFNWNLLADGEHKVIVWVDGAELGRTLVQVTTLGKEFARGLTGECLADDFPMLGDTVTLEWQEGQQNFVITGYDPADAGP